MTTSSSRSSSWAGWEASASHTHVVGLRVKEMIRLHKAGDHVEARRIDEELEAAYDLLKVETNPIAVKAALNLLGHEVGGLRPAAGRGDGRAAGAGTELPGPARDRRAGSGVASAT